MIRVVLESPFSGDVEENIKYAKECIRDCLKRGEAPIASHLLFTQPGILDDDVELERTLGMWAGWAWHGAADKVVFYADKGWSKGMEAAEELCNERGYNHETRWLYHDCEESEQ